MSEGEGKASGKSSVVLLVCTLVTLLTLLYVLRVVPPADSGGVTGASGMRAIGSLYRQVIVGAIGLVCVCGIALPWLHGVRNWNRLNRVSTGKCSRCGYALEGLELCSECGLVRGAKWSPGTPLRQALQAGGVSVGVAVAVMAMFHRVVALPYETTISNIAIPFFVGDQVPPGTMGTADTRVSMLVESRAVCKRRIDEVRVASATLPADVRGYVRIYARAASPTVRLAGSVRVPDSRQPETEADRAEIRLLASRFVQLESRVASVPFEQVLERLAAARGCFQQAVVTRQRLIEDERLRSGSVLNPNTSNAVSGTGPSGSTDLKFMPTTATLWILAMGIAVVASVITPALYRRIRACEQFPWHRCPQVPSKTTAAQA